jgi:hypothetical protein
MTWPCLEELAQRDDQRRRPIFGKEQLGVRHLDDADGAGDR